MTALAWASWIPLKRQTGSSSHFTCAAATWARSFRRSGAWRRHGETLRCTIDVLTVTEGVISAIWVVSDDLGLLRQLDAVKLA